MEVKQCSQCGETKSAKRFRKVGRVCQDCRNADQREFRKANGNLYTRRYEKTKSGFLMRAYTNMRSRIEGVQWMKAHLYVGKPLMSRDEFNEWAWNSPRFHALYDEWIQSGCERRLAPSVDRINSADGYIPHNMEWVTHSENSRRGATNRQPKEINNA